MNSMFLAIGIAAIFVIAGIFFLLFKKKQGGAQPPLEELDTEQLNLGPAVSRSNKSDSRAVAAEPVTPKQKVAKSADEDEEKIYDLALGEMVSEAEEVAPLEFTEVEVELGIDEEVMPAAAEVVEVDDQASLPAQPALAATQKELDEFFEEELEEEVEPRVITFTEQQYGERLQRFEEERKEALELAIAGQDNATRDFLQKELVTVNEKITSVERNYRIEVQWYQEIVALVGRLKKVSEAVRLTVQDDLCAGKTDTAEALLTEQMDVCQKLQGACAFNCGRLGECRIDLNTALLRYQKAIEIERDNSLYFYYAALVARRLYQYPLAIEWLERGTALMRQDGLLDTIEFARYNRELAYIYVLSGNHAKAGALYKIAMNVFVKKLGQEDVEIAVCWYQIAELQEKFGDYDKALALYKKALAIVDKSHGDAHPITAEILEKLSTLCVEFDYEKEAVPLLKRLVAIREKTVRSSHPKMTINLNSLAEAYKLLGRFVEAKACYVKRLAIAEETQGKNHPIAASILQELAKVCINLQQSEEAKQYQKRATVIFEGLIASQEKEVHDTEQALDDFFETEPLTLEKTG